MRKERVNKMLNTLNISQEYNHRLNQQYNELVGNYDELKLNVKELHKSGLNSDDYRYKLTSEVDNIAISNDKDYISYVVDKKKVISNNIKEMHKYDTEKIEKILEVRNKMIKKRISILDLNTIGTALNVLRDLYHDVYIDFERNKTNSDNHNIVKLGTHSVVFKLPKESPAGGIEVVFGGDR